MIILDETLAACDPASAEAIWEHAGLAIPLQINFALSGAARIIREIRAELHRREREQAQARKTAAGAIEAEVGATIAGLLLHSKLALSGCETRRNCRQAPIGGRPCQQSASASSSSEQQAIT